MTTDTSELIHVLRAVPASEVQALVDGAVQSLVARLFQVSFLHVTRDTALSSYGLDSMRAMELRNLIYAELGVELPAALLLSGATLGELAGEVVRQIHEAPAEIAPVAGAVPAAEARLALSFGQERLWFLHQLDPSSTAYNLAGAAQVTGPVTAAAVERGIAEIVARHEALRTVFGDDGGAPFRRVLPAMAIPVPVIDLRGRSEAEQDRELRARVAAEERQPFDLARGPLLRLTLLELGGEQRALVLGIHHLIADGASLALLMRELGLVLAGRAHELPVLAAGYSDYVAWQRGSASGPQHERSRRYWLEQLSGELPVVELPADRPRPAVARVDGVARALRLPDELGHGLRALAARHHTTLFTVLLAAFEVLLHRYSGQTDLVIGTPIAGRGRRELEPVIGFFADTLVLRADLSGRPSFADVIERTRQRVVEALDHQRIPLGQIVAALPQRGELISAMFTVNRLLETGEGEALALRQLRTESQTARFELDLAVTEQRDGLVAMLECRADRFDGDTVVRILAHYRGLLEAIVAAPGLAIAALDFVPRDEQARLLALGRAAPDAPAPDAIAAFGAQVARAPDAIAVRCGDEAVSYRALADRARRIAGGLAAAGVGPEHVVAIVAPRGVAFLAAMLGVLEAGAAWLVLDPDQPAPRLARMVEELAPRAVLATAGCADAARRILDAARADAPLHVLDTLNGVAPRIARHPASLAYAIFTSGTTGVPRAALNQRASLDHHLHAFARQLGLAPGDRVAQHAPHSFDATIWQLLAPLTAGAEVHIVSDDDAREPERLYRVLRDQRITRVDVVPALLDALLDAARPDDRLALRTVVVGGDTLPADVARRWLQRFPAIPLLNAYGPSECTDVTTTYDVTAPPTDARLPIGRPRPGSAAHVLDEQLRPAPLGVPGELYLGGVGVGRGYARRARLTAERFVPDPFAAEPGARLYRTGDVARWRADGQLEFLGRADRQLKLRGARVELGDIEAHLRALPGVRDAAVLAVTDGGEPHLVGYVVPDGGFAPAALRRALGEVLPPYMVPARYVELDALPRTAVGKLDGRALHALAAAARDAHAEAYLAPRDDAEQAIAAIWQDVLELPRVGARDDFFALGGHSLLAARVISRVRDRFGRDVPLRHLFAFPTVEAFAQAVLELDASRPADAIPAAPRTDRMPLSYAQQRLWFLQQLDPTDASYHVHGALQLDGPLDPVALNRAIEAVVARHEALRTGFGDDRGAPYQTIHAPAPIALVQRDLRDDGAPLDAARGWLEAEARRPFDLSRPALRVHLARVAPERHLLGICFHHLIFDGWSIAVFVEELGHAYRGLQRGDAIALPALAIQAADHAAWQRARMDAGALAADLAYWRGVFDAPVTPLALPVDRSAAPRGANHGARHELAIAPRTLAGLRALCEQEGASLFMVLLAAFNVLLHRHTGADDITVGSPTAGRTRPELEGVIGCFVNMLALRTDLSGRPTFRALLRRVRQGALEAYDHQELPFEKLVEEVHPDRQLDQNPLFQVAFALQNTRAWRAALGDVTATPIATEVGGAKFDLFLELWEDDGALRAAFEYATRLFDASTIARFAAQLTTLLDGIVATPDARIGELALLPAAERAQLAAWNTDPVDFHITTGFAQVFARQVERTPDDLAVVFGDTRLSYRALDHRANRIAHGLIARGAGPEQLIALLDERGVDLLAAILGVFKAGAAYLPLDPRHPTARVAQILAQGQARLLVCGRALEAEGRAAIAALGDAAPALVFVDELLAGDRDAAPAPRGAPDHLAYVIFTSGTTGLPKGAMIDQRGMLNHLYSKVVTLGLTARDAVLQDASQCFDISVWQLLAALLVGGRVVILPDDVARDPVQLYRALDSHAITVMEVVPSLLRALLDVIHGDADRATKLTRLREVVSNAETLPPEMQREWLALYPAIPLCNTYGATECSDDVSIVRFDQPAPRHVDRLPVGQAVCNMAVYVLDRDQQLAPIGIAGELYIGGVAVGRGYFNRAALTAAAFVPDPFSAARGARFYRTGDLGRYTPDGQLDFLGRRDDQIKIRGHRVELSEIEARLAEHPRVDQAVVLARGEGGADRELVAYVASADADGQPGGLAGRLVDELRAALRQQLPSYMVPALFLVMPRFPVTRNGKIDRAALPRPTREQLRDRAGYVAPRDDREQAVAAIWADVLRLDRVGVHDDFFDLGGHSLLATQVMSRLREQFHRDLPLRSLFQHRTVAEFAHHALGQGGPDAAQDALVPVARAARLPLSFAQQRFWFLAQLDPDDPSYHVHYALRLDGPVDVAGLEHAVRAVIARHESLRTSFGEVDGVPYQEIHDRAGFAITTIELQDHPDPEAEARRQLEREADRGFDLSALPLLRITLYRIGPASQVLFLNMHHIICDGWSMGVLIQELGACYAAYVEGRAPALPALAIQSYDHAVWQRRRLDGHALDPQRAYWRDKLGREVPYLDLPLDYPRPRVQGHAGAKLEFSLGAELSGQLYALCQREGVTLYMAMLAALATLFYRVARSTDVTIGSPIAGRQRPELEGVIGCLINTLVLRIDTGDRPTFRQLLARVKQLTLEAYEHQDLPFEKIVEAVLPDRDVGANPLFQVMLVLHNLFGAKVAMPGVASRHFAYESHTAKFDLLLALWETGAGTAAIIEGEWEYSTELFAPATVQRLHDFWRELLRGVVAEDRRLDDYALTDAAAARAELTARNRTDRPLPDAGLFPELFARRARQYGDRVAATCNGASLTYAALDARSNQIAQALRAQSLPPESVVALLLERGLDFLAGVLGVWKAGYAYLPVDRGHPARRIARVLEDAGVRAALTTRAELDASRALVPACLAVEDIAATAPTAPVEVALQAMQLAYVIFTSGSTGVPKGAMLHHLGLINHLFAKALDLGLTEHDAVAQIAVQTFDVSIWQMFAPLLFGGRTVILTGDDAWEPRRLFDQIAANGVTTVQSVPAHLKAMLAELEAAPGAHDLGSLRWMIMNGEGLPPDLCRRWFALEPAIPMINMYGLTECSDDSCHRHIPAAPAQRLTYMPIDGTLMNHRIYVVDDALRPTPAGLVGELCIGGLGVGRGYIRDARRTAQAFVPDPFCDAPGARMYRTGDQVRYLADGSLVFLERRDHQIKLRGRRIDLGEIETALREHPQLADAAVQPVTTDGNTRLVAYLVARTKPAPLLSNVTLHLQERVPEYMVPSDFVYLDELPRTASGKLDRGALVAPARSEARAAAHRPPVTETQQAIAQIWCALLGVPRVGLDDGYFALGGHSLAAAEMTTRVKQRFQLDVPMRAVFEAPVLEAYVERIDQLRGTASAPAAELDFAPSAGPREVYDLAPQQIPEWYAYTLDPSSAVYNVCLTLFLDGALDRAAFVDTWNAMIARHQVFRTRFAYHGDKPVQQLGPDIVLDAADVFLDRRDATDVRADGRAIADRLGNQVFDLERGPLFRVRLASYPAQRHLLVFVIHHIVWDETSTIQMIQEFSRTYNARARRQAIAAPAPGLGYLDYAQRMHDAVRAGTFAADRAYWLQQFASPPPALALPTDHPRPATLTYDGSTVDCWLPREVSARLQGYLAEHNVTLFMFLLAVLDTYLYRITGNDDLVIGCPIANREHDALKGMLGLFAVPLPLRARMRDDMRFPELLRQVSGVAVDGYEHHRYPSTLLIEELGLPKDLSRPRLFSVMYGVQNNKTALLDHFHLEGVKISLDDQIHGPEWSTARFDLTFVVDQFGDDISLAVNFNTRLFERATAERMMRQLVHLTAQILAAPDRALWDYPLMPAADAARMQAALDGAVVPFSPEDTIAHQFAARAAAQPDDTAVVFGDQAWSYAALARRAGQVSGQLAARGVGPGARVGVLLDPSFELLATLLGILDRGAAYVPLLPEHPAARLAAIVADAGIATAITTAAYRDKLAGVTVLCFDEAWPDAPLAPRARPDDVAYVIYTSGSTGVPKGIEIAHRGLVNYLAFLQRAYQLDARDRVLMTTSYVFDASIVETLWPLAHGARVVIAAPDERGNPAAVARLLHDHAATVLQGVPGFLVAVAGALDAPVPSLRLTISGGAALGREARDALVAALPGRVINHYGPTEVTVDASTFDCREAFDGAVVPIGRALDNARLFVLDRRLQLVPPGVPGEIYVASPGLARGYLGDAARTAAAFIERDGQRLYRTGDLGKHDGAGVVSYLGRRDKQVKVRGNRVELEEITARLDAQPDVSGSAVVAIDDRLAAYVELAEAANAFTAGGATYRMFTLAQRPELLHRMEAAHLGSWPAFFAGAEVTRQHWPRIWAEQPGYQLALVDESDEVVAAGNAVPTTWGGDPATLPAGWDAALTRALDATSPPDTLLILTGVVVASHQSRGLAGVVLEAFKALARGHGLARAIVPVRPTGKADHPDVEFEAWCEARRPDGAARDAWLRVHERVGGRALGVAPRSQRVVGTIAEWQAWTGLSFLRSGDYHVPGGLAPVRIDLARGVGEYDEPSVWYQHFPEPDRGPAWRPIDRAALRAHLAQALPAYMVPDIVCLVPRLPRGASGKIDEHRLPAVPRQTGASEPPRTPLQHQLAALFRQVLGVAALGIADDFFHLGGHSLLAVQLVTLIGKQLGVAVGLKDFYTEPTIAGLERRLAVAGGVG